MCKPKNYEFLLGDRQGFRWERALVRLIGALPSRRTDFAQEMTVDISLANRFV